MKLLRDAVLLLRKDLRIHFRDRNGMALGLLLPIVLVLVFGYIMQIAMGGGSAMPKVTLWVADNDASAASGRLLSALREVDMLSIKPAAREPALTAAALRAKVRDGDAHHALVIEPGFGQALADGKAPALTVVRDPGRSMESRVVGVGLMQSYMAASQGQAWPALLGGMLERQGMSAQGVARLIATARGVQDLIARFAGGEDDLRAPSMAAAAADLDLGSFFEQLVPVRQEDVAPPARPKRLSFQIAQSVSGVIVMMLMFGLVACGTTLLAEREGGTLRRLFVAAIDRRAVLLSKFLFCVVVGLLQLVLVFAVGELVFRVDTFRDPLTLAVLALTWTACATSFGMLIAAWAKTQKQAEGLSTLLILVMAAIGGCWFPVQIADLPLAAELVTRAMPTYWAMSGFQGMFWHQRAFYESSMLVALGVQWGLAVVGGGLALWMFKRRYVAG
jgi:ABC-type multidrug transport system permease subunit